MSEYKNYTAEEIAMHIARENNYYDSWFIIQLYRYTRKERREWAKNEILSYFAAENFTANKIGRAATELLYIIM